MITVLPVNDKEELSVFYNEYNFPIDVDSSAVVARQGEEMLGVCLFNLNESRILINLIEPKEDILLVDGILRSALHIADFRGITEAYYSETAPVNIFKTLDFIKNEEEKSLKIQKLHESSCKCQKNNK